VDVDLFVIFIFYYMGAIKTVISLEAALLDRGFIGLLLIYSEII